MITCEICRRHVDAFVDGEVDPDTQIEFEQHLSSCGPCRVHLAFARSFKEQVKETCAAPAAPFDLAARIRSALDAEDARRSAAQPGAPVGLSASATRRSEEREPLGIAGIRFVPLKAKYAVPAAAAAVTLAMLAAQGGNPIGAGFMGEGGEGARAGGGLFGGDGSDGLHVEAASAGSATSIFDEVVRRHSSEHPPEVTGPPTQVATWFRGKVEFPVHPIEFSRPGVRLVGARLSNVRDREAAAFFYDVRGRRVTVMVFEPPGPMDGFARHTRVSGRGLWYGYGRGRRVPVVQHHGLTYAIAGDLDEQSLLQLAASARVH